MGIDLIILLSISVAIAVLAKARPSKRLSIDGMWPLFYLVRYNTRVGVNAADSCANKTPRIASALGWLGIAIGFAGMLFTCGQLIISLLESFSTTQGPPAVQLVLPVKAPGVFYIPPVHFLIVISVILFVHEFGHAYIGRRYGWPIERTGIGALCIGIPLIPIAFVEFAKEQPPEGEDDENKIMEMQLHLRYPLHQRLAVLSAGPLFNILLAAILLPLHWFVTAPTAAGMNEHVPVIVNTMQDSAGAEAGIPPDAVVTSINGEQVSSFEEFREKLKGLPGEKRTLVTDKGEYTLTLRQNPDDESKGFAGLMIGAKAVPRQEYREGWGRTQHWLMTESSYLIMLLVVLNLGIGLVNLVPLVMTDGGQMLFHVLERHLGWKNAFSVATCVGLAFFSLIIYLLIH